MASRGQTVVVTYVAWDTAANAGKTGDVANHTLRWVKDGVSSAPTNAPAEVDGTNAPGVYKLTLTAAECTADVGTLGGKSSTASVVIVPITIAFEQLPTAIPGASSGVPVLDAGLRVKADLERWLGATPLALTSQLVQAATAVIAAGAITAIHDEVIEGSFTHRMMQRILIAALVGKTTGGGLNFRDIADTKNRVVVTVDVSNNRLTVVLDGT